MVPRLDLDLPPDHIAEPGRIPAVVEFPLSGRGVRYLEPRDTIPPILKRVIENARSTPSREEDEAAWRLVLGQASLQEYLESVHKHRSRG
jgi:hypothetical protein